MYLIQHILILSFIMVLPSLAWAKDPSTHQQRADTLKYLQELRQQNIKRLKEIDQSLSSKIELSKPSDIEKDIVALRTAKREHMLRQDFLDRLIFQVDTKFKGGDLRSFMEVALTEMAKIDAISSVETGLWKFLKFAADAVRRLPEQKENIVSFIEGYMNRSVSNPIRPDEYLNSRNYTNGAVSEAGRPLDRESVGAVAERRISELSGDAENNDTKTPPSVLNAPAVNVVPQ